MSTDKPSRGGRRLRAGGTAARRPWRRWLAFAAALYCLNFVATFHNVWPTPWITTWNELSVDVAALLLLITAYRSLVGPLSPRAIKLLAVLLVLVCIGRYAEVTAPALYGRRINLYWDAVYLPDVAAMLTKVASPWLLAAGALGVLALLGTVYALMHWSLRRVCDALERPRGRRGLALLSGALVAAYGAGYLPLPVDTLHYFSLPVSRTYLHQAEFVADAYEQARDPTALPPAKSFAGYDLARVAGADVFLIFVESYGAVVYDAPALNARVAPARKAFADAVAATGRGAVSAFVTSPTFGGGSVLAHSTLMTGTKIDDMGTYKLLLTQRRDTLSRRFGAAGYRAVALMPGLKRAWPEGEFYDFAKVYGMRSLNYRGPPFGWWRIPDEYALADLDAREHVGSGGKRPLFVFYPTISTHIPFHPTPPYQPNWARMLSRQPYGSDALAASLAEKPDWSHLRTAYGDSVAYSYRYLAGYLRRHAGQDIVFVLLGDHQPASSVSGEGARWDVPVHVIASRPEVLDSLRRDGFVAGLTPTGRAIAPMQGLTGMLLRAFSSPRGTRVSAN
jgi:hypothetical protein